MGDASADLLPLVNINMLSLVQATGRCVLTHVFKEVSRLQILWLTPADNNCVTHTDIKISMACFCDTRRGQAYGENDYCQPKPTLNTA